MPGKRSMFAALLFAGLLAGAVRPDNVSVPDPFPLSAGTYWVYRGLVRSFLRGLTYGQVTDVTWKMSVVRAIRRDGFLAAVVNGFPADLDWSDGHAEPQLSILVQTQDGKFHLDSLSDAGLSLEQLDDPRFPLEQLLARGDWILQLPLSEGVRFSCDDDAGKREDGMYCWVAGEPHPAALEGVKGVPPGRRVAYAIDYVTVPDDTELEFVSGIGITSYQYHHHGTIAETELHLVEFHAADRSSR